MNRHDLAYLIPNANVEFLELSLPNHPKEKIHHLLDKNIPLTVSRQDQVGDGKVKLAMSCFVNQQKYRVAVLVEPNQILKITPPVLLANLVPTLPFHDQDSIHTFLYEMQSRSCEVYVYGSYAYQYLTQEHYVSAQSDLDLVLYPKNLGDLNEILISIQRLNHNVRLRIDGEIKIHPNWHVSFHELIQILPDLEQHIIAKGIKRIGLFALKELLGRTHADTAIHA